MGKQSCELNSAPTEVSSVLTRADPELGHSTASSLVQVPGPVAEPVQLSKFESNPAFGTRFMSGLAQVQWL